MMLEYAMGGREAHAILIECDHDRRATIDVIDLKSYD